MGKRWDQDKENRLVELFNEGKQYDELGEIFNKSSDAVAKKLRTLGYKASNNPNYYKETVICKFCNDPFRALKSENRKYCSSSCSISDINENREHTDETREKISNSIKEWHKNNESHFSNGGWKQGVEAHVKKSMERLMDEPFEDLSWDRKRKRILIEQKNTCDECGIKEWQDKPLSLEIDHIDGNKKNNERGNLRGLCPNCHSQTDTFRGRNKGSRDYVSDEDLLESLKSSKSIRQALLNVGMAGKGANYKRVKKLMLTHEIEKL